jgi:nucleoside-diphosphate-sugar epimerase
MKIAITGGAGFIGARLAAQLAAQGHEIVVIDINAPKPMDVTDEAAMMGTALKGVDIIYNLAAEHRDDVRPQQRYYDVNVTGAKILVKAAKQHNIKTIIFTSTVAVYGLNAGESLETDTPAPFNDYGHSKLEAEEVFNNWANEDSTRTLVTMRLVATFGPGNRGNIYNLMNQIAANRFVMVGNGDNHKSVAYVENIVAFLQHCLTFPSGKHLYNYADKPDLNMRDMVAEIRRALGYHGMGPRVPYALGLAGGVGLDAVAKVTGRTFPISAVRVRKFCADTIVNAKKAHESGFKAPYALQDGVQEMIRAEFMESKNKAA